MVARVRAAWADRWALFVDVDDWLLDRPHSTYAIVPIRTLALLGALHERLRGAVALLSTRPIVELDALVYPLRAACAGLHGLERRDALGGEHRLRMDLRSAHVRSSAGVRRLLNETLLNAFMGERPFAGRRPLWLAASGAMPEIVPVLASAQGLGVQPRRALAHGGCPIERVARALLGPAAVAAHRAPNNTLRYSEAAHAIGRGATGTANPNMLQ